MRVAIVHDWLTTWAGAECVLERLLTLLPQADLYTVIDTLPAKYRGGLLGRRPRTTYLQHMPKLGDHYRMLLPLMPMAIKSWDFSGYDLIVSSSHAVAKGVTVPNGVRHVCYCHTPMRYAWDLERAYMTTSGFSGLKAWAARQVLSQLRDWDCRSSAGVTEFVANSAYVADRIERCYGRDSVVVHPPVDTKAFALNDAPRSANFMTAGRIVQYKRVDVLVEAFRTRPNERLIVIGDGPGRSAMEAGAPSNVHFTGRLPLPEMRAQMQSARAFLFAAEEDFGITPLEAQSCGTPVIAFGRGAALETIRGLDHATPTGVFFDAQTPNAVVQALDGFNAHRAEITADACRNNAMRFSTARFDDGMRNVLGLTRPALQRAVHTDHSGERPHEDRGIPGERPVGDVG
jgi:glycosyltransferase involved in cell wall biosynthesis